jgi:hypothetical protein
MPANKLAAGRPASVPDSQLDIVAYVVIDHSGNATCGRRGSFSLSSNTIVWRRSAYVAFSMELRLYPNGKPEKDISVEFGTIPPNRSAYAGITPRVQPSTNIS